MGSSSIATGVALAVLLGPGCVASQGSAPDRTQSSPAAAATEPSECADPAVRRVCTEIALISRRVLEPTFESGDGGRLSVTPEGYLRYEIALRDPGNTPEAIRSEYDFVFTELEKWRRVTPRPPYDLRFLSRGTRYATYEALIDVSGTAENRESVEVTAMIQTTQPTTRTR